MKLTPSPAIALFALGCIGDGNKDTTDDTPPMAYTTVPATTPTPPMTVPMPPMPYTTPTGDTGATGTMMGTPGISPPPLVEPDETKAG